MGNTMIAMRIAQTILRRAWSTMVRSTVAVTFRQLAGPNKDSIHKT